MSEGTDTATDSAESSRSQVSDYLKHPLVLVLLTFLLSGVAATLFTKWLDGLSHERETMTALRVRSTDSVKEITDVLYERKTRGDMLASSIRRQATPLEVTDRKQSYDKIYVIYNSGLQSAIFRLNQFLASQQPSFDFSSDEISLRLPSALFALIDRCLTSAVDNYLSTDQERRQRAALALDQCYIAPDGNKVAIEDLNHQVQECIHEYTLSLYEISSYVGKGGFKDLLRERKDKIKTICARSSSPVSTSRP